MNPPTNPTMVNNPLQYMAPRWIRAAVAKNSRLSGFGASSVLNGRGRKSQQKKTGVYSVYLNLWHNFDEDSEEHDDSP